MFPDKLKSFFQKAVQPKQDTTLSQRISSLINSNRRTVEHNPTAQFQQYLQAMPWQQLKTIKQYKPKPKKTATLRPQLVIRCYKNVPPVYFDKKYQISSQLFTRNRKEASQKTSKMHQYLDEVEICLFNQISSRFDQILAVLRTIQSLECVVDYNSQRLKEVRGKNVSLAKKASLRHLKIVSLLKRQQRLKNTLQKLAQIKIYTSFIDNDPSSLQNTKEHSQRYQHINEIRMRRDLYFKLTATQNFQQRVEQVQSNLKKSYSDSINDAFFKYAIQILPYDCKFWQKKFIGRIIFEQDQEDIEGTVILDESMLMQEDTGGLNVRLIQQRQRQIASNVVTGWRQGQYATGSLKAALDKYIKQRHHFFQSQCRNFCFQSYIRQSRKKIQNPNLSNLMKQMNIFFCSKTFIYYSDMYRTLLTRCFSLSSRLLRSMIDESRQQLSIQQKQKIIIVVDGLFSVVTFVFKIVYEKILQLIDLKHIYDSMQIQQLKQLINVLQTQQDFINKHLKKYISIQAQGTFLEQAVSNYINKFDFQVVTRSKEQKVLSYLNRTHRYIIQNQLRQSFQNQIWKPTDIPTFYYDSLHFLITGQSLNLRRNKNHTIRHNITNNFQSSVFIDRLGKQASVMVDNKLISKFRIIRNEIIIQNKVYKVTGTLLLLLQFIQDYMHLAQFYPSVTQQAGIKIFQLMRAYHTTSHQLIFLAGAVKLNKIKSKTITARHLALNSLCLSFLTYIINCIKQRVPIHDQQKIRNDLMNHEENIIKRLGTILNSKYTSAINDINLGSVPSKGTQAIVTDTKKLHDILMDFYQKDVLGKIFVRSNVQLYLNRLKAINVGSRMQAQSIKDDMNFFFTQLKFLQGLISDFKELRLEGQDIIRTKFQEL